MQNIVPSTEQLKQEIIMEKLKIADLDQYLIQEKELKKQLSDLQEMIKERKDAMVEEMLDLGLETMRLGDKYLIETVKGGMRQRIMSLSVMRKKFPHILESNPELVVESKVKSYIKVVTL